MESRVDLGEYVRLCEPDRREKSEIWKAAIGLQAVDGLKPSQLLTDIAKKNIEGYLSFCEAKGCIDEYYKLRLPTQIEYRIEEADKVSVRCAEILSEETFTFSPIEYLLTHQRLFEDVLDSAIVGKPRDYNIKKEEWVLQGKSVVYANAAHIMQTLAYDFEQEKDFSYQGLSQIQMIEHLGKFISRLWQIHVFGEGNTRTTAVFAIKYLRTLGFDVNNDLFATYSWYFRNALVRANYNDYLHQIHATHEYLTKFLENLLFNKKHLLKNREMLITPSER